MENVSATKQRKPFFKDFARHFNFYRIHLLFFTFTPLIAAGIFYASNGENKIAFIDALFMCVSAMTVTGLASVLLSNLTTWQQVILFILMTIGSTSSVSIITILIRKHFFRKKFKYMVETSAEARQRCEDVEVLENKFHRYHPHHLFDQVMHRGLPRPAADGDVEDEKGEEKLGSRNNTKRTFFQRKKKRGPLNASMIRRVDKPKQYEGKPEETQGEVPTMAKTPSADSSKKDRSSSDSEPAKQDVQQIEVEADTGSPIQRTESPTPMSDVSEKETHARLHARISDPMPRQRRMSDPVAMRSNEKDKRFKRIRTADPASRLARGVPHAPTIEFADMRADHDLRRRVLPHGPVHYRDHSSDLNRKASMGGPSVLRSSGPSGVFPRTTTYRSAKTTGFGGFPNPVVLGLRYLHNRVPPALERATTMNRMPSMRAPTMQSNNLRRTATIYSSHSNAGEGRPVNYISFDAIVGRNSHFRKLTTAQEEELGGVEYRALSVLLWIVVGYYLSIQLISVMILAPYLSRAEFRPIFDAPDGVLPTWYTFFNVWSAFSNLGMSLIDASLTVFQDTYLLLLLTMFNILAGNTALPIFLRLTIWAMSKIVPAESRLQETLRFLLDHPRRCFIYLFPAYQTWFLVFVLIVLNCVDWFAFLVLDIGNAVLDQIPLNVRVIDGLMQALAVRAAGFAVVSLSAVAPALQVLYVIMMYVAVYPIALSIRSTNVYESRSMGVYEESEDEDEADERFERSAHAGSYIAYHARKQLAFDLWWLVLALWLICIIERNEIANTESATWFNQFTLIFEIASAYGTVGLSLGLPYSQTSLSGALRVLSKLVLCAVMIRGRHRGLPNAIDRSILLPNELRRIKQQTMRASDAEGISIRSRTRRPSMRFDEEDDEDAAVADSESDREVASQPARSPPSSPRQATRRLSDAQPGIKFSDSLPSPTRQRHMSDPFDLPQ